MPLPRGDRLHLAAAALRSQHDEAGQVVGLGAQAVPEPRAHPGRPEILVPVFMNVWAGRG